ncbi:MAG: [FeFe] hydrogenase H-cluster radical SAM maturase HydG [bacterium]
MTSTRRQFTDERDYRDNFIRRDQVDKYLDHGCDFIPDDAIHALLAPQRPPEPQQVRDILVRSLAIETLLPEETAALLRVTDPGLLEEMVAAAWQVKHKVYDNRIVTFAPLYMSNLCVNHCAYCGFRCENAQQQRSRLTMEAVRRETEVLAGQIGHKRLIVVYGEHPETSTDYIAETIRTVYGTVVKTRRGTGQIRRVNVNAAPLPVEDLRVLKEEGIGTYQVFQETYHHDTYRKLHGQGTPKADYAWRITCMHRALEAGVDDVGIGALFGLYDWRFEVLGLLHHARELERRFKIGPHTISFPRLEPASGTELPGQSPWRVSDEDFLRLVTVIRLSVPYTGMLVTAREGAVLRDEAVRRGCTQMDAGSRVGIGAYANSNNEQEKNRQQFLLGDERSLEELVCDLARQGTITSFCTAGYRCGRTGGCIMDALKTGKEGKFCKVNAVLTFREWLDDFASPATLRLCEPLLQRELGEIQTQLPQFYPTVRKAYDRIERGERDLFF